MQEVLLDRKAAPRSLKVLHVGAEHPVRYQLELGDPMALDNVQQTVIWNWRMLLHVPSITITYAVWEFLTRERMVVLLVVLQHQCKPTQQHCPGTGFVWCYGGWYMQDTMRAVLMYGQKRGLKCTLMRNVQKRNRASDGNSN